MSKITVELDSEAVDQIIVDQLLDARARLLIDYERGTTAVFDIDPHEDRKQIAERIKAFEKTIDWFSVPGTYTFDELATFTYEDEEDEEDA